VLIHCGGSVTRRPALRGPRASGGGSARWGLCPPDPIRSGGRAWALDRPLLPRIAGTRVAPSPPAAAGRGPVLPARCLLQGMAPEGGPPGGAGLRLSASADPPFQGGGEHVSASNGICIYKTSLSHAPADGPNGGEFGPVPPASRPRVRGRAAGEYVAALLPLLGQAGRRLLPRTDGKPRTAWEERRLEGDAPSGPPGTITFGYGPITASRLALSSVWTLAAWVGRDSL
jgi:hypothetical protein